MKYLRLVSDIHLDFDIDSFNRSKFKSTPENKIQGAMGFLWMPQELEGDNETTFIIAGDLWYERKFLLRKYVDGKSWMQKIASQFKYVFFVLGNHDYWKANISNEISGIKKELELQGLNNVFVLENTALVFDNIKFVGATLWTDYNNHNLGLLVDAPNLMNDYKKIRFGANYGKLRSTNLYKIHKESRSFIFQNAIKDNDEQKLVVVTHMAPSARSLTEKHRDTNDKSNYLYVSDMESEIEKTNIDYWFHGHIHESVNYNIGVTKVMSNPRGYWGENAKNFQSTWKITL